MQQTIQTLNDYKAKRAKRPIRAFISDSFESASIATNIIKLNLKTLESEYELEFIESQMANAEALAKLTAKE